ncbi:MAG: NAD(P)-binding domain-containing protein [Acidobacteriota bacterium]|nr:NAD(P)-binding domain-containing protein [Acidobacteriota bacterium]
MHYDYIVVGGGPSGLQLGYFLEKMGHNYLVLEASDNVGAFFRTYPRHRTLISINKVYTGFDDSEMNLRWDWNSLLSEEGHVFTDYCKSYFPPADDLVRYLEDFKERFKINTRFNYKVGEIGRREDGFYVNSTTGESLSARQVIVATGLFKLHKPDFPGVELADDYTKCSIDPQDFVNKRVLVVGKGNSALETADALIGTTASLHLCSPKPVKLAWETHFVGNVRAVNNNFLDTYQLKSQNVILDADIQSLERDGDQLICKIIYTHAKGERRTIPYDHVILATGFDFDTSIFAEDCKPELAHCDKLPAMTSAYESTNISGLYFSGVLMQSRDFKKTMSGFIHGFRHNTKALAQILNERNHNGSWPKTPLETDPLKLARQVIDRLNRSPSMFLQPGYFCDMLVEDDNGGVALICDVPRDYIPDGEPGKAASYFTISLEYGDFSHVRDPFGIDRDPDPKKAHLIEYLHPIIRRFRNGQQVGEYHLVEDVENDYDYPHYEEALSQYFTDQILTPVSSLDNASSH